MSIEEIRGRLEAATPGPWQSGKGANPDGKYLATTKAEKAEFLRLSLNEGESELWLVDNGQVIPAVTGDGPRARDNAEFIAHAPEDVRRLLSAVEAVEELHQPRHDTVSALYPIPLCSCEQADYPCETVKAITSALEAS